MKFILLDKTTGVQTITNYPRHDKGEIVGMDTNLELYHITKEEKPDYDPDLFDCVLDRYELTEEKDSEYPVKIALKKWKLIDRPIQEKIEDPYDKLKKRIKDLESTIEILAKNKSERTVEEKAVLQTIINNSKI
jgi:hypothetical protein